MKNKAGERTLLTSLILSSPGPLVVGAGLLVGKSSTQLADFVRRSAELVAIVVSWFIYRKTEELSDPVRKARLERTANVCVGLAMCCGGAAMILVAYLDTSTDKGNVIPGLVIALLGVITNGWFWFRYRQLARAEANAILAVQSSLYRAKTLVDAAVTAALISIVISPVSVFSYYMDLAGSAVVAIYLMVSGALILAGRKTSAAKEV